MGTRLRVFLNAEERRTLMELRTATTVPQRTKDQAEVIRLSHQGLYVKSIATYVGWHVRTVRETLQRWQKRGLGGLWDVPRQEPRRDSNQRIWTTWKRAYERSTARTISHNLSTS